MLSHNALDPDYANLWPNGAKVRNVSIAGNTATVDVGGASANNVGAQAAEIAVQQLVWTATAVPNIDSVTHPDRWRASRRAVGARRHQQAVAACLRCGHDRAGLADQPAAR